MAKITEDYVSFEVAKLLKEKGFNIPVWTRYENDDEGNEVIFGSEYNWNNSPMGQTSAPTHQMAIAWLREIHNIDICTFPYRNDYILYSYNVEIYKDKEIYLTITDSKTYEESVEAALKYCLENLI